MMKKNAIALAVAAMCGVPFTAAAAGHWEVMTPSSVSESAPQLLPGPHLPPAPAAANIAAADVEANTATGYTETVTARSVEGGGQSVRTVSRQHNTTRSRIPRAGGMPNPQTPYSPNESGEERYTQEMQAYKQHLASVEQARIATAESYAPAPAVAQVEPAPVDKEAAAEIDRLLATPTTPPADRERESVARVNPALVDSRTSPANELQVEGATTGEPARDPGTVTGEAARDVAPPASERAEQASTPTATAMSTSAAAAMSTPADGATSTLTRATNTATEGATSMPTEGATSTPTEGATSTIAAAPAPTTVETTPIEAATTAPDVAVAPASIPPVGATAMSGATAETQGSGPAQ